MTMNNAAWPRRRFTSRQSVECAIRIRGAGDRAHRLPVDRQDDTPLPPVWHGMPDSPARRQRQRPPAFPASGGRHERGSPLYLSGSNRDTGRSTCHTTAILEADKDAVIRRVKRHRSRTGHED
jgi:hypothetical protein